MKKKVVRSSRKAASAKQKNTLRRSVRQPEDYGYPIDLRWTDRGPLIVSGCRRFTFEEARTHWIERSREPWRTCTTPEPRLHNGRCGACNEFKTRARAMLKLLPTLKRRASSYGWPLASKQSKERA